MNSVEIVAKPQVNTVLNKNLYGFQQNAKAPLTPKAGM